jgi:hypothetical protein
MKRVHDHKEESVSAVVSPEIVQRELIPLRKTVGRKRKASSPTIAQPAAQRVKRSPLPYGATQVSPQAASESYQDYQDVRPQVHTGSQYPLIAGAGQVPFYQQAPVGVPGQYYPMEQPSIENMQHGLLNQWTSQKEALIKQLDSVHPGDQAGIQRIACDVRRLSWEQQG